MLKVASLTSKTLVLTVLLIAVMATVSGLSAGILSLQASEPNMGPVEEKLRI